MLKASVVIPSYNNLQTLLPCLRRLESQIFPVDEFEVVVVVDGSTDGTAEALKDLQTPYLLRPIVQANTGRAGALNRGAEAATGEFLIVIDADILVNDEFIARHVEWHEHGDVVIGPIPLAEEASPRSFVTEGVREWAEDHTRRLAERPDDIKHTQVQGANYSIRRDDYLRIGGNRADLRRAEDYQFGRSIALHGLSIVFCPSAVAAQIYDKDVYELGRDFYIDGSSQVKLAAEFPELRAELALGSYHPMSLTKRIVRPLVIERRLAGRVLVASGQFLLERARRLGLCWRLLRACQGVLNDALYFRGVFDAVGGRERFAEYVRAS